jgi:hypothetical protein
MSVSLTQPAIGSTNWGGDVNTNWQTIQDSFNNDTILTDALVWFIQKNGMSGAFSTVGISTPTNYGTLSSLLDSSGDYVNCLSSTSVNGEAGIQRTTADAIARDQSAIMTMIIKTGPNSSDLSGVRIWCGAFSSDPYVSDDPTGHLAAFRYSTNADGTAYWRTATKDGSTLNVTTTSTAIAANTRYVLKVVFGASNVKFYIDGTLVATHSSNLPTGSTAMGYSVVSTNITAAAHNFRISKISVHRF